MPRDCVVLNQAESLRALFRGPCGEPVNPTSLTVYFYAPSADVSPALSGTDFSGASSSTTAVTNIATGFYEVSFTPTSEEGVWYDVWVATINGITVISGLNFTVQKTGSGQAQVIRDNAIIVIDLDASIAATSGNSLGTDTRRYFTTTYNPYYASPDLVKLELGNWVSAVPDSTIALMVHWASLSADVCTPIPYRNYTNDNFLIARTQFTLYETGLRLLRLPISTVGGKKQLGELLIQQDGSAAAQALKDIETLRDRWKRVMTSGGALTPGQSYSPTFAQKGRYDPARRKSGRLWLDPREHYYIEGAANAKVQIPGGKYRSYYTLGYNRVLLGYSDAYHS